MGSTLYYIGNTHSCSYDCADFQFVLNRFKPFKYIAYDTETSVENIQINFKLKVISISWDFGAEVAVFEWSFLSDVQKEKLYKALKNKILIAQNAKFDYTVSKLHSMTFENWRCTMLAEKIITSSVHSKTIGYGLAAIVKARLDIDISKDEQKGFDDYEYLTDVQIEYSAMDVVLLERILEQQIEEMKVFDSKMNLEYHKGMLKTFWWENEYLKVLGDSEIHGVRFDEEQLISAVEILEDENAIELEKLNKILVKDFKLFLIGHEYIFDTNTLKQNLWSSSKAKLIILSSIYPGIEKTSKVELRKYLRDTDPNFPEDLKTLSGKKWDEHNYTTDLNSRFFMIKLLANVDKTTKIEIEKSLNDYVLDNMLDVLKEHDLVYIAGEVQFNWNSNVQRLKLFKEINPNIESTGKEYLIDFVNQHEIIAQYLHYNETVYLLQNFGRSFYNKNVGPDGRIRGHFNQILATGRVSSSAANLLGYPKYPAYRRAIVADPGHSLIGADFDGEELNIMANLSSEDSWLDAIEHGYDLHSINSSYMYGYDWEVATEEGCEFKLHKKKCSCPEHMKMRTSGKTLVFLSSYGGSHIALAFKMKITESRAEELLNNFYDRVPKLKAMMDDLGAFALSNGYIYEPVFGRPKIYEKWRLAVQAERGSIMRTASNLPIQGSGAAIIKIFGVLFRRWIMHNGYFNVIKLLLMIHDESLTESRKDVEDLAKSKVEYYMILASKLAGFDINAEAGIGHTWHDVH